ncbi:MAG: hypothetical protein ACXVQT_05495 [Actinomycetota bacterium]|jgi:hypothetical protein
MGAVIDLAAWKKRRERVVLAGDPVASPVPVPRLDAAVARLERLMRSGTGRISARVETELLAITGAVTAGRMNEAAQRAERLAERLEHPSSSLAR